MKRLRLQNQATVERSCRRFFNWAGRKSLFTLHLGIKCCAIRVAASATPRFDGDRFGVLFRSSPRQSDVFCKWSDFKKFADPIVRLWEQMPEPKYCIAMGECAISGGPYYQVLQHPRGR